MTAALIGVGWALGLLAFLTLVVAAVEFVCGWRLVDRVLAPASGDERFELSVLSGMEADLVPSERRRGC